MDTNEEEPCVRFTAGLTTLHITMRRAFGGDGWGCSIVGYAAPFWMARLRVLVLFRSLGLLLLLLLLLPFLIPAPSLLSDHVSEFVGMSKYVGILILRFILPCWPLEERTPLWCGSTRSGRFCHGSGCITTASLCAWGCGCGFEGADAASRWGFFQRLVT